MRCFFYCMIIASQKIVFYFQLFFPLLNYYNFYQKRYIILLFIIYLWIITILLKTTLYYYALHNMVINNMKYIPNLFYDTFPTKSIYNTRVGLSILISSGMYFDLIFKCIRFYT